MKKTLHIDEKLLSEAKLASGAATDTDTVRLGLEALVRHANARTQGKPQAHNSFEIVAYLQKKEGLRLEVHKISHRAPEFQAYSWSCFGVLRIPRNVEVPAGNDLSYPAIKNTISSAPGCRSMPEPVPDCLHSLMAVA